jgi:F0F1-type ATP synthase membrane subunit b/b'
MSLRLIYLVLLILVVGTQALAAGGGEGVPSMVINQTVNFLIYITILFLVLKGPAKAYFKGRLDSYNEKANAALKARELAAQNKKKIQTQLQEIDSTEMSSIEKAKSEANNLKNTIISEANLSANQIKEEAKKAANLEYSRAQDQLLKEFFGEILSEAESGLKKEVATGDHSRFEKEFVSKLKAVH